MNKADLFLELQSGNKASFRRFFRTNQPKLLAYVRSRISNQADAEEIVQDAFLSFLDSLPLFRGKSSLWTFLVSIAKHEIADYYRKKYAKRALKYVPFVDKGYTPDLYTAKETRAHFNQALESILPREKRLIVWKYEHELSVEEIADRLGISIKAAESRLFRARKAFQVAYVEISNK